MQQKEFEALTGKKVTAEEYADIEKVYMAIDGMDKETFCAAWNEQKFGYIVDELVKQVENLRKWRDHWKTRADEADEKYEAAARMLLKKAEIYGDGDLKTAAIELAGLEQVVLIDVEENYKLSNTERSYVLENL